MKFRKNIIVVLNVVIPLLAGVGIYIFMKNGTYINTLTGLSFNYSPKTLLGVFAVNWLCDFLWAYALVFALYFTLSPFRHKLCFSAIATFSAGTVLEFMQKFSVVTGTFDFWDIIAETAAVIIAVVVLKVINKL